MERLIDEKICVVDPGSHSFKINIEYEHKERKKEK